MVIQGIGDPDWIHYLGIEDLLQKPCKDFIGPSRFDQFYGDALFLDLSLDTESPRENVKAVFSKYLAQAVTSDASVIGLVRDPIVSKCLFDFAKPFLDVLLVVSDSPLCESIVDDAKRLNIEVCRSQAIFDMRRLIKFENMHGMRKIALSFKFSGAKAKSSIPVLINPDLNVIQNLSNVFGPIIEDWIFIFIGYRINEANLKRFNVRNVFMQTSQSV